MKKHNLVMGFVFFITMGLLTGCSTTYPPAPIGDELVWSSEDKRPEWTVKTPKAENKGKYLFVGQSYYHSNEKAARENAQIDAATQAASFFAKNLKQSYHQNTAGGSQEGDIQDLQVSIDNDVVMLTDEHLKRMDAEDWHLEMWNRKGQNLWKAYVLVAMPKTR